MSIETESLKNILEAALLAYGQPLSLDRLVSLFGEEEQVSRQQVRDALQQLQQDCEGRSVELVEVGSGYRYQARKNYGQWVSRLWEEKPPRYSRALLETLALVAYRQPITRAEVEDIRGVTVSSHIMKTLQERDWVRVVGHKDVPGKPALYATTKVFLDYFNLKSLDELPSLMEIRDLDKINPEAGAQSAQESNESSEIAEAQALVDEPDERLLPDGEGDHGDGMDEVGKEITAESVGGTVTAEFIGNSDQGSVEEQGEEGKDNSFSEFEEVATADNVDEEALVESNDEAVAETDLETPSLTETAATDKEAAISASDIQVMKNESVGQHDNDNDNDNDSEYDSDHSYSDNSYGESGYADYAQSDYEESDYAGNNAAVSDYADSDDMDSDAYETRNTGMESSAEMKIAANDFDSDQPVERDSRYERKHYDVNSDNEDDYSEEEQSETLSAAEPHG